MGAVIKGGAKVIGGGALTGIGTYIGNKILRK
ncbi:GatB family leaderless bacteriocin [Staphylococcus hominis]|nr:GatB family leaderless bacteriocin [Staphylococcus hominis]MBJ6366340.1 GatB family leaderless bacteriocin [Staphylococcus hominis]MDS3837898.1 GatB family leaderless bacteriocin [Staphylococcus hominis]